MKYLNIRYKRVFIWLTVFFWLPLFVLAKTCYVDDDYSGGDGSKEMPYKKISEALENDCQNIKVKEGFYDEKVSLGKKVKLEGDGNKTILAKEVEMKDGSVLEDVYVKNGGVEVLKDAGVVIKNVKISGAHIGIETVGGGKLTVLNSEITGNHKGLYLQYGKDIEMRGNEVVFNSEEGVDIRANVDGIIENNQINNNKEGGIEVIVGKSELTIKNNSIKNNKASGIAIQFYSSTKNLGELKIMGNILSGNGNYGVDCKIPSGGKPIGGYWSKSVIFGYNKIEKNKKGSFDEFCGFSKEDILKATLTKKELMKMEKEEKNNVKKKENEGEQTEYDKMVVKGEKDENLIKEKSAVEKRDEDWKARKDIKNSLENDFEELLKEENSQIKILEEERRWKIFFLGADEKILEKLQTILIKHREKLCLIELALKKIEIEDMKDDLKEELEKRKENYQKSLNIYRKYKNKFGLVKWFKNLFE